MNYKQKLIHAILAHPTKIMGIDEEFLSGTLTSIDEMPLLKSVISYFRLPFLKWWEFPYVGLKGAIETIGHSNAILLSESLHSKWPEVIFWDIFVVNPLNFHTCVQHLGKSSSMIISAREVVRKKWD